MIQWAGDWIGLWQGDWEGASAGGQIVDAALTAGGTGSAQFSAEAATRQPAGRKHRRAALSDEAREALRQDALDRFQDAIAAVEEAQTRHAGQRTNPVTPAAIASAATAKAESRRTAERQQRIDGDAAAALAAFMMAE